MTPGPVMAGGCLVGLSRNDVGGDVTSVTL